MLFFVVGAASKNSRASLEQRKKKTDTFHHTGWLIGGPYNGLL